MRLWEWSNLWIIGIPVGVMILYSLGRLVVRRFRRDRQSPGGVLPAKPISTAAPPGRGCLVAFGSVFLLVGLGVLTFLFLVPIYRSVSARHWPHVQGVVSASAVQRHSGDDGDTYSIEIRYRYHVAGRAYEGSRYDTTVGSSSGYDAKQRIVAKFPPGAHVEVFYDPADPSNALLSTAIPRDVYLFFWFPLIFIGVGLAVVIGGLRQKSAAVALAGTDASGDEPAAFTSIGRRRVSAGVLTAFAMLWNGFLFVMVRNTGVTWFAIPFVLIGLAIVGLAVYQILALMNPIVSVTVDRYPIRLNEPADFAYELRGRAERIQRLSLTLQGLEKVTFRQGTNTRTESSVVYSLNLLSTVDPRAIRSGRCTFTLPADVMASFKGRNNAFLWQLVCKGEIPKWPDVKDTFEWVVLPAEAAP